MLDYREIRPAAPVARFVECFWTLTGRAPAPAAPDPILPDGCMELILNCAAPFIRHRFGRAIERQPARMLVGQMDHHLLIAPTGRVDLVGIRFHPAGARAFLHAPMSEFAGHTFALDTIARELDRDLTRALDGPIVSRILRIEAVLAHLINSPRGARDSADAAVEAAVTALVRSKGCIPVDALAATAALSPRHLERRFLDAVGLGPKRLARILRFQRVFRAVSRELEPHAAPATCDAAKLVTELASHSAAPAKPPDNFAAGPSRTKPGARPNWAAVAADCGYYDQAHLIRDFREFAGQTPTLLLQANSALTRHFTRSHRFM